MSYTYVHHSGRYDRTPESLAASLLIHIKLDDAEVIGFTEVAANKRSEALRAEAKKHDWAVVQSAGANGMDECALAYDASKFDLVDFYAKVLSNIQTTSTAGKPRAPFTALFVVLKDKRTGKHTVYAVAHTPSHVQDGGRWYKNRRALQHRAGCRVMNREVHKLGRDFKVHGRKVISMDLNLDVAQPWVRRYLAVTFIGPRLVADTKFLDTHDHRTIDVVILGRGLRKRGKIKVRYVKDSDHKAIIVEITAA